MRLLLLLTCAGALAPALAGATEPGLDRPSFLPPDAQILEVLEASPAMAEARARMSGAQAEGRALAVGDHETLMTGAYDARKVRNDRSYGEWSLQISRGVRLPGKATLDRAAGAAGVKAAHNSIDDARHQASLVLAERWIGWMEAAERRAIDAAELDTYGREVAALTRRVELKDAAPMDLEVARGAQARATAALARSTGAERQARSLLDAQYPGLAPQSAQPLPDPRPPFRPLRDWSDVILQRSHEITIARALADREKLMARRAQLDRAPDPTFGLRTFNERGGEETGVGVFISAPFGGPRRSAEADRQVAAASVAEARFAMVARDVRTTAAADVIAAEAALSGWTAAAQAREASDVAAARVRRAYDLGERDLSDRLTAERQAFDARRDELGARSAAHQAILKLALDAHELWLADED